MNAAALEESSRHPLAAAFMPHARADLRCADAHEMAGRGVEGEVQGRRWRVGGPQFAAGLAPAGTVPPAALSDGLAGATLALGDESGLQAIFRISDELRPEAPAMVRELAALGLDLQLASGDRPEPVAQVARTLGLPRFEAQLRPEAKLALLRRLQQDGHQVLMIGDGINDGPVLAAADVSMAMGNGSSIAHAAGDLVLLRETLGVLPQAIGIARRTLVIVRQNLRWAAVYNLAAIPLAALGLMPPWVAAIGMSLSSLFVVLNARRIIGTGAAAPAEPGAAGPIDAARPLPYGARA